MFAGTIDAKRYKLCINRRRAGSWLLCDGLSKASMERTLDTASHLVPEPRIRSFLYSSGPSLAWVAF